MRELNLLLITILGLLVLAVGNAFCAGVIYVKWDSPTNGPGTNWNNAYHSIQAGINAASWEDVGLLAEHTMNTLSSNLRLGVWRILLQ